jgi:hypothetical protein
MRAGGPNIIRSSTPWLERHSVQTRRHRAQPKPNRNPTAWHPNESLGRKAEPARLRGGLLARFS